MLVGGFCKIISYLEFCYFVNCLTWKLNFEINNNFEMSYFQIIISLVAYYYHFGIETGFLEESKVCGLKNNVNLLEKDTGLNAINKPGGQHVLNDEYFKRIEAINYTLEHDDGEGQKNLELADVIIVGVSRTSKTPTCIYLANKGIKAANYPLVPDIGVSKELDEVKSPTVVALITSAQTLVEIRRKRSLELGLKDKETDYINVHKVEEEIIAAKRIFANKGWPVIDITRRSVEETASAIMNIISLKEKKENEQ